MDAKLHISTTTFSNRISAWPSDDPARASIGPAARIGFDTRLCYRERAIVVTAGYLAKPSAG
jgi:hypothetical protein